MVDAIKHKKEGAALAVDKAGVDHIPDDVRGIFDKKQSDAASPDSAPMTDVSAYVPELSLQNWNDGAKNLRWDATPSGRLFERVLTRGVLGAAGFAWGGWYASQTMKGFHPNSSWQDVKNGGQPLQYVAKALDETLGKSVKSVASFLGSKDPENFVRFRTTHHLNRGDERNGRSLGHEMVSITFDFCCSSFFDASGRGMFDALDPHIKHTWRDEHWNIKPMETIKSLGKSLWRYASYNAGEDIAVAFPYAYYMRGQRHFINKFSPGFNYDSDRGLNGGSQKVDKTGQNIIGNYNVAGLWDLQGRFTAYNIGTLMYREWYNWADNALHGHHTNLYGSDDKNDKSNQKHGILHSVGNLLKWTARSVVKGVITMTPAVPFFSIFRTPQSKYKGLFINPDNNEILGFMGEGGRRQEMLHANEHRRTNRYFTENNPDVTFRKYINGTGWIVDSQPIANHVLSNKNFTGYDKTFGVMDSVLNKVGKVQNAVRKNLNGLPEALLGPNARPSKRSMDVYANAAMAYTPYMYAKRETAILWDNGKTDVAVERMIDGAADLNFKEFKAGGKELWKALWHEPFDDPNREAVAHARTLADSSPADGLTKENYEAIRRQEEYTSQHRSPKTYVPKSYNVSPTAQGDDLPSWQDRLIHARQPEKQPEDLKSKPVKKRDGYADEETMRVLRELQPPTNSIH